MKKPLIAAGLLLLGLAGYAVAGRANFVWHLDKKSGVHVEILTSAGACRHHLSAHPEDYLMRFDGPSHDPADCN
jgi:hypothetical protein